jgi:hypothetical protein
VTWCLNYSFQLIIGYVLLSEVNVVHTKKQE